MGTKLTLIKKTTTLICLVAFLLLIAAGLATAKDVTDDLRIPGEGITQIIKLKDGTTLTGKVTQISETDIKFRTSMGELTVTIADIKEISEVKSSSFKGGEYWFPNPNQTRLYIAPTARMLEAGSGYFADADLFFPSFAYGLTDFLTIGGGVTLFPGVDFDKQILYISPKIGVSAGEKYNLAVSGTWISIPDYTDELFSDDDEEENLDLGMVFGVGTYGSENNTITLGLGWGFVEGGGSSEAVIIIGGEFRISRRMSFVTENWKMPDLDQPLGSYGVRFLGEKLSVDLAFFTPLGEDAIFPGFPFVGFVYNF
ncbi:MAG: hypothetical protein JXA92_11255 [candidate division Zixibacteria bacterium]|nr:hypothetical protein [candidate division Zixibacteria bacterium]